MTLSSNLFGKSDAKLQTINFCYLKMEKHAPTQSIS